MPKTALITGVSGQDGAYLAQLLLRQGYRVVGSVRRMSDAAPPRLAELNIAGEIELVHFERADLDHLKAAIERIRPDEVYNLAAQSSVGLSFERPLETVESGIVAFATLLEAARCVDPAIRFFQASTCEMFGQPRETPQNENTPFRPCSPYAVAKLFAHWQTVCYREREGLFGACGILFNHESPLRGRQFVTRKITVGLAEIKHGRRDVLQLGSLDASRDWGFAGDYVRGMWQMLQQSEADDFVLATGVSTTVREFISLAAECLGFSLEWSGSGVSETGIDRKTGRTVIAVSPEFFRPTDVTTQVGDAGKARRQMGWKPSMSLSELVVAMTEADERRVRDQRLLV